MANTYTLALASHDLSGKMKAIVLTNEDPKHLGRVGVYIPRVMNLITNGNEAKQSTETVSPPSDEHTKDSKIHGASSVTTVNYIWARPFMYGYSLKGQYGGEWKIPPVGAKIIVEFIDANPQDLFYMPFAPYDEESGYEFSPYESESGNVNIEVLLKSLKKNIILFDSTDDKDLFIIKMQSGMEFIMDAKNNKIDLHTNEDESHITIDNGDITINNKGNVNVNTKGNVSVTTEGTTTLNSKGDVSVTTEGNATLNAKGNIDAITEDGNVSIKTSTGKIHLNAMGTDLWQPNCVPMCPLTQTPHGGFNGGITNLDGN